MRINWFQKWFILNRKERYFIWFVEMLEEKYYYACLIDNKNLTFKEFLNWYKKELNK